LAQRNYLTSASNKRTIEYWFARNYFRITNNLGGKSAIKYRTVVMNFNRAAEEVLWVKLNKSNIRQVNFSLRVRGEFKIALFRIKLGAVNSCCPMINILTY
jgi:hypothetical protein